MKQKRHPLYRIILLVLPAILWMTLIFYLSSRQRVAVSNTYIINFMFFKFLHVTEYSILYTLVYRALCIYSEKRLPVYKKLLIALIITLFYAMTDEIHQTFVPTREGTVRDVVIDSIGIAIMYSYIKKYPKLINKLLT